MLLDLRYLNWREEPFAVAQSSILCRSHHNRWYTSRALGISCGLASNLIVVESVFMKNLVAVFLFIFAPSALAQTTFHGNNARTGAYDSPGPKQFNRVKWVFKTDGPIVSSPAIANGVVFIGSSDGGLYALDQETGQQKWKVMITDPIASSPAVANGLVYFITYDGVFYALAADSGAIKWRFATGGERRFEAKGIHGLTPSAQNIADPMDLFLSSPAVFNGRVYFGSSDGHVYALDAQTGILQWSFETGDIVHASPARFTACAGVQPRVECTLQKL